MTALEFALELAAIDWYVFPCVPGEKRPYTKSGMKEASIDPSQIHFWWGRWPDALIGIHCKRSRFFAVDPDSLEGHGVDGIANWVNLVEKNNYELPDTPTQNTPSGGQHLIFKHPPGMKFKASINPGVDIKANGYICTGDGYKWIDSMSPFDLEPPDAPAWLLKLAVKAEPKPEPPNRSLNDNKFPFHADYWLKRAFEQGTNGNRNATGLWLACQLRDNECTQSEAETVMLKYQQGVDMGSHPYTQREALASLAQAWKMPPREPATIRVTELETSITGAVSPLNIYDIEPPPPNDKFVEPKYKLFTARDALQPLPPVDWVIENLIPAGTVTIIYGDAGSKKTYTAIDAAVCVALGLNWLHFGTSQGPVLFIDEEMGPSHLRPRLSECLRGHFGNEETPFYFTSLAGFDLRQDEDTAELHRLIRKTGAKLVVIDALMDVIPGADENSVKDVLPAVKAMKNIADKTGASFLVIHHANKSGKYRGSTAIKGGVDLMLEVDSQQGSDAILFKTEKPRFIAKTTFSARAVWDNEQFYLTQADVDGAALKIFGKPQSYVVRFLAKHGPSVMKDIKGNADICAPASAQRAVYNLVSLQYAERVDDGGAGVSATYALTNTGLDYAKQNGFEISALPMTCDKSENHKYAETYDKQPVTCDGL